MGFTLESVCHASTVKEERLPKVHLKESRVDVPMTIVTTAFNLLLCKLAKNAKTASTC